MQTLIAHSAFWRGVLLFAGTQLGKVVRNTGPAVSPPPGARDLVSWNPGARSRREDELARSRQTECH